MSLAYKAVFTKGGNFYSLGMGNARQILLPTDRMRYGGKHGISAAKTVAGARAVLGFVLNRKVKPKPDGDLMIVKVLGKEKFFENKWRVIFKSVKVIEVVQI